MYVILSATQALTATASNGLLIEPGEVFNLGNFAAESNQTAAFTLSNTSSGDLYIESVKPCCAYLTPVVYEKQIPPGEAVPLDILIDANTLRGPFNKSIKLSFSRRSAEPVTLQIKGTAQPAISTPSTYIHVGHIPLQTEWTTNLSVAVRENITGNLKATARSNIGIIAAPAGHTLQIRIPAQRDPLRWKGSILLQIEGQPHLPPIPIHLEGCSGGSLHPLPHKVVLSENSTQASLTLHRKYSSSAAAKQPLLQCNVPTIGIREVFGKAGTSTVHLQFPAPFMQQLKEEQRIQIQLSSEGFTPATLTVDYAP